MKLNHQQKAAFRDLMNQANAQMEMGNLFACASVLEALIHALEALIVPADPTAPTLSSAAPGTTNPPPGGAAPSREDV